MENLNLNINGREYSLRQANFFETKQNFTKLLSLAKQSASMQGSQINIDIGQLISNIGSSEFESVENFILVYSSVISDGKEILFKNRAEAQMHFNKHRSDYIPLIIEGLKYHFLDLLPGSVKSLTSIADLVAVAK